jgi:hypothetical protein
VPASASASRVGGEVVEQRADVGELEAEAPGSVDLDEVGCEPLRDALSDAGRGDSLDEVTPGGEALGQLCEHLEDLHDSSIVGLRTRARRGVDDPQLLER